MNIVGQNNKTRCGRKLPKPADLSLLISLPLIPVGLFVILIVVEFFRSPSNLLVMLPNLIKVLFAFIVIFAFLGFVLSKRIYKTLLGAINTPWIITISFLLNTAIFMFIIEPPFTEHEIADFKKTWPIFLSSWLLFPLLESKRLKEYYGQNKVTKWTSWILRGPVLAVVFFTALTFVIVDGSALFANTFNFIICTILKLC